ncbi:MAG: hypothetical protein CVU90_05245 [Firmicutes bacterium HGW-Firmicutes-15]|nr:MAG: hypothetical protein CVU90_05245 [Firmicutes bacterium HGW-Firmicutes-15]
MSRISCILCPPSLDFYYMFQRPHQLMQSFSELQIRSYFMNRPYLFHPEAGIKQLNPYFYILNQMDIRPYLNDVRPVIYFTSPDEIERLDQYNPALVVFDSVDEPSGEFASWNKNYRRALRRADVVLASSENLYKMALGVNPNTHLVPNACDYDFFCQAVPKNLSIPKDMQDIHGPIIAYSGAIATWCDLQLVERLADSFSHCSIVMIGPLYNVSQVPSRPNIHWLGMKPYQQLPSYFQQFDVGIIPFKISSMVEAVNPIKMWEYLAAGIPVVTTAIPEAGKYSGLVLFSENEQAFMDNVKAALYHDNPAIKLQRMDLARNNSWTARARQIIAIMEENLARKGVYPEHQLPISLPTISRRSSRLHCIDIGVKRSINIDLRPDRR